MTTVGWLRLGPTFGQRPVFWGHAIDEKPEALVDVERAVVETLAETWPSRP